MPFDLGSLPMAQIYEGAQYLDTGWFSRVFTLVLVAFVLLNIKRAKSGKDLYIRRIAGLNAIDEAVGRATEMGRPVLMVPGLSGMNAIVVQALNIFVYVTRLCARFANPILVCCADAAVYTVAQEMIRDTYQQEGAIERYDTDSVRFISDRQFAFAAGVSGLIQREQAAATFFMGAFYAESLIFAETANSTGAIQIASSTETTQTPFFIAACDYVLIGDEFYAASAYLTRQPILVGSLVGQDWSKILIAATALAGALNVTAIVGPFTGAQATFEKTAGVIAPVKAPRAVAPSDAFMQHLLQGQGGAMISKTLTKPQRPKDPDYHPVGGGS